MKKEPSKFHIPDPVLFLSVLGLIGFGMLSLSSAADGHFLIKQIIYFAIASGIVAFLYLFDISFYKRNALYLYGFSIFLLIIVKLVGTTALGAQRWISLGPIHIQPSEVAKICIIIALAAWLSERPIRNYLDIAYTLLIVGFPAGLVIIQPDLGTTIVFGAITLGMIFWAGASLVQILIISSPIFTAILSSVGYKLFEYNHSSFHFSITVPVIIFFVVLLASTAWFYHAWDSPLKSSLIFLLVFTNVAVMMMRPLLWGLLKEYQQKRLTIFLDPSSDPLGAGYHIIQSLYAIGSGGLAGKGVKAGELTQGNFVPEQHTDFIFSIIGEEMGLLGSVVLLALYVLVCIRLIRIAKKSSDMFSSLILIGILSMFIFHIFVNIGMTLSLMPITGVPLPFVSYGGTSLLVNMFLASLALKIASDRKRSELY